MPSCACVARSFRIEAGTRGTPVKDDTLRQAVSHSVMRGIQAAEITGTRKRHHPDRLQAAARTLTLPDADEGCNCRPGTRGRDRRERTVAGPTGSMRPASRTRREAGVLRAKPLTAAAEERPKLLLVHTPSLHPARRRILVPVVVSHRRPGKAPGRDRRVACDGIAAAADPVENTAVERSDWGDLPG
jgi:hypothetical protein